MIRSINMKICPICHAQIPDDAVFCPQCGANTTTQQGPQQTNYQQTATVIDIHNHTADFDKQDVSDNKLYAALAYVGGVVGIVIGLLARSDSKYLKFHMKQAMKYVIMMILVAFTAIVPFLGWAVAVICEGIILVCEIISFVTVCANKSKDAFIISNFKFLD